MSARQEGDKPTQELEAFKASAESLDKNVMSILDRLQTVGRQREVSPICNIENLKADTVDEVETGLQQLLAYANQVCDRMKSFEGGNGCSTLTEGQLEAKRIQLEALAKTLEERVQTLENASMLKARLAAAEKDRQNLRFMADNLQRKIEELEQLQVVVESRSLQETACQLKARVDALEQTPRGVVPVVQPAAAESEMSARVRILESQLAAKEQERELLRRELEQSKQCAVQVVQPTVQPTPSDPEVIAHLKGLIAASEQEKENLRYAKRSADDIIQQLQGQINASDQEKMQLRFELEQSQKHQVAVPPPDPNPEVYALVESLQSQNAALKSENANILLQFETSKKNAAATIKQLEGQEDASDQEKLQLRYALDQSQKVVAIKTDPNPEVLGLVDSLQSQITALNGEKADLFKQFETSKQNANSTIKQLEGTIQNNLAALDAAQRDAQNAKNQMTQLEKTFKAREQQDLRQQSAELDANSSQVVCSLQSQLASCSQEKVALQIALEASNDTIHQLESEIQKIRREESVLSSVASEAVRATDMAMEAVLHPPQDPRVPDLVQQIEGLSLEVASCQLRLEARINEKGELERELQDAKLHLQSQDRNVFVLRQDLEVKDKQIMELSEQLRTRRPSLGSAKFSPQVIKTKPRDSGSPPSKTSLTTKARELTSPSSSTSSPINLEGSTRKMVLGGSARPIARKSTPSSRRTASVATVTQPAFTVPVRPGRTRQLIQNYSNLASTQLTRVSPSTR